MSKHDVIDNTQDLIDSRDVIARFEELESELTDASEAETSEDRGTFDEWLEEADSDDKHTLRDAAHEFILLRAFLEEMKGNGGDEQWRGDWYPVTLVRDTYFEDFARDEAEQLDLIKNEASWPYTCIDWEKAASELQMDYTSVEFDGVTYWVR